MNSFIFSLLPKIRIINGYFFILIIFNNTMSQVDHVINIIDGILMSKEKTVREAAEKTLVDLRSSPN